MSDRHDTVRLALITDDAALAARIGECLALADMAASLDVVGGGQPVAGGGREHACLLIDERVADGGGAAGMLSETRAGACPAVVTLTADVDGPELDHAGTHRIGVTELTPGTVRRVVAWAVRLAALHAELAARDEALRQARLNDPLTALPNRHLFLDRLGQTLRDARRTARPFAVLMMDLDHFKGVNDTLGQDAGDELLCQLARRMASVMRGADTVARTGGDEFAALLSTASTLDGALIAADKLHGEVCRPYLLRDGGAAHVGLSIGVAMYPEHGADREALLRHADAALDDAKAIGAHAIAFGAHHSAVRESLLMSRDLPSAVAGDGLTVYYQPQLRLVDQELAGVDVQVRWRHPELGVMGPTGALPDAERVEVIEHLTLRVLEQALAERAAWRAAGVDAPVSVALSARLLHDSTLVQRLHNLLEATGVPAGGVCLSVSERAVMQAPQRAEASLSGLANLGVRLAVDDFGASFSSLQLLRELPLAELRVDRAVLDGNAAGGGHRPVLEAMLALGDAFGVRAVARGIDSATVLAGMRSLGCEYGQGRALAAPMTAEAFRQWLVHGRGVARSGPLADAG